MSGIRTLMNFITATTPEVANAKPEQFIERALSKNSKTAASTRDCTGKDRTYYVQSRGKHGSTGSDRALPY
jgi:hypothetical protein